PPEPHPQIPTTPWHHTHHWIDTPAVASRSASSPDKDVAGSSEPSVSGDSDDAVDSCHYRVGWPTKPLADAEASTETASGTRWLVFADTELGAELGLAGGAQTRVDVIDPSALTEESELLAALAGVEHVVYAPPAGKSLDVNAAYQLFHQVRRLVTVMTKASLTAKLLLVTRNAQPIAEGDRANPAHGVLWGLGRTIALEHPEIWRGIIDLDESMPAELAAPKILDEVTGTDGEDQVVYRCGGRHVPRLQRRTAPAVAPVTLDPNSSQLVIGATGNIGPYLIRQLAQMGAKTVVAVSRNPGQRLQELAESLAAEGANLVIEAADATDEAAMTALFDRFGADLPPLEGIYLAAFAGGPVLLNEMTDADVRAMFAPKLDAAALLHRLSLKVPARHFVLFSSISGLIGSRWLAHYTATSGYLDALAYARHALGLPATTVNWGLWKSLADAEHDASQVSVGSGLLPMQDEVAIGTLPLLMNPAAGVHSVVVEADWPLLAAAYRTRGSLHIVDDLLRDFAEASTIPARDWSHLSAQEVRTEFEAGLRKIVARELRVSESDLETDRPLAELGLNSLMAMAIRREAEMFVGIELSATMLFNHPTVASLASYLANRVAPQDNSSNDQMAELSASAGSTLDSLFDRIESSSLLPEGPG
ncbi:beta-ketoacyl reductase, partial [Mycobacterium marinum]|uniref:beta-ketoacyl reductase n=1 Tax=Mycobacterium marinum TaxID=1781 RepID=UPI00356A9139